MAILRVDRQDLGPCITGARTAKTRHARVSLIDERPSHGREVVRKPPKQPSHDTLIRCSGGVARRIVESPRLPLRV